MEKLQLIKVRVGWDIITCPYCDGTGKVKDGLREKPCFNPLCVDGMAWTALGYAKAKNLLKEAEG